MILFFEKDKNVSETETNAFVQIGKEQAMGIMERNYRLNIGITKKAIVMVGIAVALLAWQVIAKEFSLL